MDKGTMIGTLVLALGSSGGSAGLVREPVATTSTTNAMQQRESEFKIPTGKKLDLQLQTGGSVNITGWDKEVVSIKLSTGGRDWQDCQFDANETPDGLQIVARYQGKQTSHSTSLHFEVQVPKQLDIQIESAGGNLELKNLSGEVNLTTMGGNVLLLSSEISGKVETMGGQVVIQDVTGNIKGSSMGGEVKYINVTNREGRAIRQS
jgi:DUF4097 and DUF4098 domain-containing protein YvlB